MRLWKKIPNCWRCDFFDSAQTVTASGQNALHYDWSASGSIMYTYVEGNTQIGIDPTGLVEIHGNWCGPDWTGGRRHPYRPASPGYYLPPTGYTDAACERHDKCFSTCRELNKCDKSNRASCMVSCNQSLANAQRFGSSTGTSIARSAAIWLAMQKPPDPEGDDPSCDKCGGK